MSDDREFLTRLADGELGELLQLLHGTDVEELELQVAGTRLYFRRNLASSAATGPESDREVRPVADEPAPVPVLAERVGFFHYPGQNGAGEFQAGDRVALGQQLGVIDSLSVAVAVTAPCPGLIGDVLVGEGQPVEYGQPLFVIRPCEQ